MSDLITSQIDRKLIDSLVDLKQTVALLFEKANKKIQIYSHNLDPRILNSPTLEKTLTSFIRTSRHTKVEILIYNERYLQDIDHRLVALAQNFTSYVHIRVVPKDFQDNPYAFYLIDDRFMLYRTTADRYETEFLQVPHLKIKEKSRLFNEIWQQSDPASHLRALHL